MVVDFVAEFGGEGEELRFGRNCRRCSGLMLCCWYCCCTRFLGGEAGADGPWFRCKTEEASLQWVREHGWNVLYERYVYEMGWQYEYGRVGEKVKGNTYDWE